MYNILDYGATPQFKNNAPYIQKAIDDAYKNGGGKVLIPEGKTFTSGTIILKSNVELYLEQGSLLQASDDLDDFNLFSYPYDKNLKLDTPSYINCEYNGSPIFYFIYCKDQENITISGTGKIDGNEKIFYGKVDQYQIDGKFYPRMPLLYLENIKQLRILNVTLTHSAFWTVHMVGCENVLISQIQILNNLKLANCDGIDPDHCKDVRITSCYIQCADDGIVFKNTEANQKYGDCKNITVDNCTIISTSAAIKFGSESFNNFTNILVNNVLIHSSNRGISFQLRDKGNAENICFSNMIIETRIFSDFQWWGKGEPISITAVNRFENSNVGTIKNIQFNNIQIDSENGLMIYGEENLNNISNICFNNIHMKITKKSKWEANKHDLRPRYKESLIEGERTILYIRNASNIKFKDFTYDIDKEIFNNDSNSLFDYKCDSLSIN